MPRNVKRIYKYEVTLVVLLDRLKNLAKVITLNQIEIDNNDVCIGVSREDIDRLDTIVVDILGLTFN